MPTLRGTETLDKLYLEWSQFTSARTEREIRYANVLRNLAFDQAIPTFVRTLAEQTLSNLKD